MSVRATAVSGGTAARRGGWAAKPAPATIGVVVAAVLLFFALTAAPAAAAGPTILAYSPPVDSEHMSPLTKPWVKFSEQIDSATVTSATYYMMKQGSGVKTPAAFEFGPAPNTVKLAPLASLEGGAVYEVTVTAGVRDLDGEALTTPWSWTFRVEPDEPPDVFVDVPPGSPYYDAIHGLYQAGIVDGVDGPMGREFRPANPIWRQQFAKMIVGSFGLSVTEEMTSPFTDLGIDDESSLYPHEYVAAAYARGITNGVTATNFGPYREITRAQVVTMGVRALENLHPAGNLAGLDPWGVMPRGEVALFLWNVLALLP